MCTVNVEIFFRNALLTFCNYKKSHHHSWVVWTFNLSHFVGAIMFGTCLLVQFIILSYSGIQSVWKEGVYFLDNVNKKMSYLFDSPPPPNLFILIVHQKKAIEGLMWDLKTAEKRWLLEINSLLKNCWNAYWWWLSSTWLR